MRSTILRGAIAVAVALVCMLAIGVSSAAAGGAPFTGGAVAAYTPNYIPNDHTPQAIRFSATDLTPTATYEVKVRLAPTPTPLNTQNRGFTWNPAKQSWSRNRNVAWAASNFPTVTADASGNIDLSQWIYFKFGNEENSGPYYIIVTLCPPEGDTYARNGTVTPLVNVMDMKTQGTWVHNGSAAKTVNNAGRVVVATPGNASTVTALPFTYTFNEPNLVDDDADGIVDNENWWLPETKGWRIGVPVTSTIDVWIQKSAEFQYQQTGGKNMVVGLADQDIAVGASDTVAPSKPTSLSAQASMKRIDLSWTAPSDTDIASYRVYRWASTNSTEYTNVHALIGTTTSTAFADLSTVVGGIEYNYEVRAVDTSTNVSVRSAAVSELSIGGAPAIAMPALSTDITATRTFDVSWTSTDSVAELDYEVEYTNSAGRFTVMTKNTSANLYATPGQTYAFRVRSYDQIGNVTAWSSVAKTTVPYDQTSLKYSSGWKSGASASCFLGSTKYTYTSGASAGLTFSGATKAYLITSKGSNRGKLKVYVDGKYKRTVDLYSATSANRAAVYLGSFSTSRHSIKLVQLTSGSRKRVDIDGLAVIR